MADLADVETALKALIVGWLYPGGVGAGQVSAAGMPVLVARGWPTKDGLEASFKANAAQISIYSQPGAERLTTRYPRQWVTMAQPVDTITATASGATVTFGGAISMPQNIAVLVGRKTYLHAVQFSDTLASIAAALAAEVAGASSSGATLTVPSPAGLKARVGGVGKVARELRRQERLFQITIWADTPEQRDALAGFVDAKFAGAGDASGLEFITLPDGFSARVQYVRTAPTDKDELSGSFRRDLIYSVEYATTETTNAPQIVAFETKASDPEGDLLFDTYA